jgi:hypothetical protein
MATEPDVRWIERGFPGGIDPGNRMVFGIIREATVSDPGKSAHFIIYCSDGTTIEEDFVYSLNPCEAIGGLARLELTPDNRVGARRFKAIEDMLEAHKANLAAEERMKQSQEKRRKTLADKDPRDRPATISVTHRCGQGAIKLRMVLDVKGWSMGAIENLDYSGLHLLSTKVTIEIIPNQGKGRKLTTTLSAAKAEKLIGGTQPCTETYEQIYKAICEQKGIQPPTA